MRPLAEHYGLDAAELPADEHVRGSNGLAQHHRGGLLGLGAVLTVTSAPLRTSAVKRGDWVLRRVIGTPVPPPPADAGSIPADDVAGRRPDGAAAAGSPPHRRVVHQLPRADRPAGLCPGALRSDRPLARDVSRRPADRLLGHARRRDDDLRPDGLRGYLRREQPQFHRTICAPSCWVTRSAGPSWPPIGR